MWRSAEVGEAVRNTRVKLYKYVLVVTVSGAPETAAYRRRVSRNPLWYSVYRFRHSMALSLLLQVSACCLNASAASI